MEQTFRYAINYTDDFGNRCISFANEQWEIRFYERHYYQVSWTVF